MSNFKDFVVADIGNVFFNPEEHGESHIINGKELVVVVDNDQLLNRTKEEYEGISVNKLLYYVSAEAYGKLPLINEYQEFDNRPYFVLDANNNSGVYEILLQKNG